MGNLYVELDNLGKAIILYNECLKLIQESNVVSQSKEFNLHDLEISANYNLGIIYFITDQYVNSKNKLTAALYIKKELKNDINSEQAAIITETIGEIEIENKNFSSAFTHLQDGLRIRNTIGNKQTKDIMKIKILLDYLYQNLESENTKQRKGSINHYNKYLSIDDQLVLFRLHWYLYAVC